MICSQLAHHLLSLNSFFVLTGHLLGPQNEVNKYIISLQANCKVLYIIFVMLHLPPKVTGFLIGGACGTNLFCTVISTGKILEHSDVRTFNMYGIAANPGHPHCVKLSSAPCTKIRGQRFAVNWLFFAW